jgi:predicted nucleic acid-binding protein
MGVAGSRGERDGHSQEVSKTALIQFARWERLERTERTSDRLIAATAMVEGAPPVTADERIRQAKVVQTIW